MAKVLTIAVDVRSLQAAKTGTKTYLEELCREFKNWDDDNIKFYFLGGKSSVYTGHQKKFKLLEHVKHQLWKQLILPLKAFQKKADIVFCTDDCVPLMHLGYQTIPVIHDAFCFEMPANYGRAWLWLYKNTAIPAAKRSAFVVTPTEWAKKQIIHFTDICSSKLIVIAEGPKSMISASESDTVQLLSRLGISRPNYLLHVGAMYKRKNLPALIGVFAQIKKMGYADLKLVLAGSAPANQIDNDYAAIVNIINSHNLQSDVVLTGYLADTELNALYANATAYVFPSTNEGFGIPVLEAFKNKLPVLVASNTCLPEVGGDAVVQFDPTDDEDMLAKIKMVLDDTNLREEMIAKGVERLKQFSWHKTATQLIEVFKRAANVH